MNINAEDVMPLCKLIISSTGGTHVNFRMKKGGRNLEISSRDNTKAEMVIRTEMEVPFEEENKFAVAFEALQSITKGRKDAKITYNDKLLVVTQGSKYKADAITEPWNGCELKRIPDSALEIKERAILIQHMTKAGLIRITKDDREPVIQVLSTNTETIIGQVDSYQASIFRMKNIGVSFYIPLDILDKIKNVMEFSPCKFSKDKNMICLFSQNSYAGFMSVIEPRIPILSMFKEIKKSKPLLTINYDENTFLGMIENFSIAAATNPQLNINFEPKETTIGIKTTAVTIEEKLALVSKIKLSINASSVLFIQAVNKIPGGKIMIDSNAAGVPTSIVFVSPDNSSIVCFALLSSSKA